MGSRRKVDEGEGCQLLTNYWRRGLYGVMGLWWFLLGSCLVVSPGLATSPGLAYNMYTNAILHSYYQTFAKAKPCECRNLCFTAVGCTAVSVIGSPGDVECRLANQTSPTTLLTPSTQDFTLVKQAKDLMGCRNGGKLLEGGVCNALVCENGTRKPTKDSTSVCCFEDTEYGQGEVVLNGTHCLECKQGAMEAFTMFDNGTCWECVNSTLQLIAPTTAVTGSPCTPPFETHGNGCYYYHYTSMPWCLARKNCVAMGGDLAMDDFTEITGFLAFKNRANLGAWVAVRRDMWLTGAEPMLSVWRQNEPNEVNDCGNIVVGKLRNVKCTAGSEFSVCQLL